MLDTAHCLRYTQYFGTWPYYRLQVTIIIMTDLLLLCLFILSDSGWDRTQDVLNTWLVC